MTVPAEVATVAQSIADFKEFVGQRFIDQNLLISSWRQSDQRLLDERFKTQTTTLDAAFAAAEKARQEALSTATETQARVDSRISALELSKSGVSGRGLGRADAWGFVIGAAGLIAALFAISAHL